MNERTALVIAGLALVVGVVGLVIGISAKSGNKSDEDVADSVKTQLESQIGTVATEAQGQGQSEAQSLAARTIATEKKLDTIDQTLTTLTNELSTVQGNDAQQTADIKAVDTQLNQLQSQLTKLQQKP
jgi:chromosome segregation ATPase